jgi:hypothetical protein
MCVCAMRTKTCATFVREGKKHGNANFCCCVHHCSAGDDRNGATDMIGANSAIRKFIDPTKPKLCTKCFEKQEPDAFGTRQRNGYVTLNSWCKTCVSTKAREGKEKMCRAAGVKIQTKYIDYSRTPCLLGIALGMAPIPREVDKDRVVCGAGQGSGRKQRLSVWARVGEL